MLEIILFILILVLIAIIYFEIKENRAMLKSLKRKIDKQNKIAKECQSHKDEEEKVQKTTTEDNKNHIKKKKDNKFNNLELPFSSKKPFPLTENIAQEDFLKFQGAKVLLVEDNVINQKIILSLLKKSGIMIKIANNGKEALKILEDKKEEFDLVLMDINMPVMDGEEATQELRKNSDFDTLPIVTFTAFTQGREISQMFDVGANAHITKPIHLGQLYEVCKAYLDGKDREITLIEKLKISGLDVKYGLEIINNNEVEYRQSLREFVVRYKNLTTLMPKWIEDKKSEQILLTCTKMGETLAHIGAYELGSIVFRMRKIYIYNTEHRIEEFSQIFPEKLEKLLKSIEYYLNSDI